jgi:hypothetical protein
VDQERGRWSRGTRGWGEPATRPEHSDAEGAAGPLPQQLHLVSQGYPVRIRRALVAGGLALALAVAGALAASQAGGGAVPTSEQSDAAVTTVGLGS